MMIKKHVRGVFLPKCWKCGEPMIRLTCTGDSCQIDICMGKGHYPMVIKEFRNA